MALFGPGFDRAGPALALLLLMPALATLSSSQNMALLALNRPLTVTYITVARMVTILTLSTLLSLTMGMTGVALGVVCGYTVDLALQLRLTRNYLTTPLHRLWPAREVAGLFVAYRAGFLVARAAGSVLGDIAGLAAGLPAGAIAYIAAYAVVGGVARRDVQRFRGAPGPPATPSDAVHDVVVTVTGRRSGCA